MHIMKKITIKNVADDAQVSYSTASFVLNGLAKKHRITQRTAKKVLASARNIGFVSTASRNSSNKKTRKNITLIMPCISRVFVAQLIHSLAKEAEQNDCTLDISYNFEINKINLKKIQYSTDMLIIWSDAINSNALEDLDIPVIAIGSADQHEYNNIEVDIEQGIYDEISLLLSQGYRDIYLCSAHSARIKAYKKAFADNKLSVDEEFILCPHMDTDSNEAACGFFYANYLKNKITPKTAFVSNDQIAMAFMNTLYVEKKILSPNDYAVVGFDNLQMAKFALTPLTSCQYPFKELANVAISKLLKDHELPKGQREIIHKKLIPKLIIRDSSHSL